MLKQARYPRYGGQVLVTLQDGEHKLKVPVGWVERRAAALSGPSKSSRSREAHQPAAGMTMN